MQLNEAILVMLAEEPNEPLHRLAYADWLEDQGIDGLAWRTLWPPLHLDNSSYSSSGGGGSGGYGGGAHGGGSGDGGNGGHGGGSGDGGSGDDGGGGGNNVYCNTEVLSKERIMPKIGDRVLVHTRGSYYPYAWCGEVVEIETPRDYVLTRASLLPHTREPGVTWKDVAEGEPHARAAVRIRRHKNPVEVKDVCYCTKWVGELPTQDQH